MTLGVRHIPVNKSRRPNALLMLGQGRRRWTNVKTAVGQRLCLQGFWNIVRDNYVISRGHEVGECAIRGSAWKQLSMVQTSTDHISLAEHYDIFTVEMYYSFNLINPYSAEDTFLCNYVKITQQPQYIHPVKTIKQTLSKILHGNGKNLPT